MNGLWRSDYKNFVDQPRAARPQKTPSHVKRLHSFCLLEGPKSGGIMLGLKWVLFRGVSKLICCINEKNRSEISYAACILKSRNGKQGLGEITGGGGENQRGRREKHDTRGVASLGKIPGEIISRSATERVKTQCCPETARARRQAAGSTSPRRPWRARPSRSTSA